MNTKTAIKKTISNSNFPVVAIGTAPAQIDLLKKIISDFPADSGMSYVVFENLFSSQTPNLAELLSRNSKISVVEIVHDINIQSNTVYVIPENNFLICENGSLKLQPKTRTSRVNNGLDLFFEAISQTYQSYAVGLMLTWTTIDGSAGLKKLKEAGGSTMAVLSKKGFIQNADTSEYIDYFTNPHEVSNKLLQIYESNIATHSYVEEKSTLQEEKQLDEIIKILLLKTGTDFQHYKHTTLRRRISKRMVETRTETIEKYINLLKNNPIEQDFLFNDILIPVTYFFRDEESFNNLCKSIYPFLIEDLTTNTLRIWSAGCSTGEEAYSLAICAHEYLEEINRNDIKVQIIASDLSEKCISKARLAIYTAQDVKNISSQRLEKYFIKRDNSFHVNKVIRDMCVFAVHDLTKDAPFSKIDFVSCRNVLIYFNADLKNQVLASFHYALREKGFLFLGKSEWAQHVPHLFTDVDRYDRIYVRKKAVQKLPKEIFGPSNRNILNKINQINDIHAVEKDYRKIASDILLEHFSPPAVIINEDLEIVHFHGDTSPFLQPAPGKPSFNLLSMIPDEMGFELRNNILKARNEKKNFSGKLMTVKKQSFLTSFEIVYLPSHTELLLIVFCKVQVNSAGSGNHSSEIEKQLFQLRDEFKKVTEEQQIYFEELQTTNEELAASNEELQEVNHQLENFTQELQSSNQELLCLNDELKDRREELASMRNFYESIVKTIREPLFIVDKNFIIKSANPSFYNYFKTTEEETEGFSIFEIGNSHWNIPAFKEAVLKKTAQNNVVENFKIQFHFDLIGKKTMLINAAPIIDSFPNGMTLIALEDITDFEQSRQSLKVKNQELQTYNKQLEAFTSAASENLLEPIRKISMFAKKVLDTEKALTETGKHNLNRLLSSTMHLNQLIEDVIDYSKINFGQSELKNTDLNALLKKTIISLRPIINQQKTEIEINKLPALDIIASQIQQLFSHLITNSIKYAKQDTTAKIRIGAEEVSSDEIIDFGADPEINYIKIFVADNGIGFHKNFESLIFNPFYKLENNAEQYSSGLGLTLVQKIVYNHKGFIKVVSEPNKGTTVFIYLPS
ncbi:CheR family methyltransferase [Flavobacterium defluvii]|uniref:Two-component system, chemotaxis family, CheB/CheR fusion protein n=1 Tax=Flavobacterium defluvii TaxID=370979 RepID=A0A1M5IXA4_9FLAO|nr:CheR family methyltransferase [Flavobacterium defluvii]SHG32679.1 two-component system, chemotaxis family, CheB/CheR fusion protein [Flavobacterium defluvii]